jgi:phenylalanyl-tRNA synthetase beta chain
MKFTLSWLKDQLDTTATLDEIVTKLTEIGLEVEGVEDPAASFSAFKVVEVMEAVQHPNADRLRVCQVKTDKGMIQVVCGAPNARAGMKAILAPEGSYVPGIDMTMKKTKIRDVESNGMLASEREMGLPQTNDGIIDIPVDTPVGTPLAKIYGLDDPVIEIKVLPNRPDSAGIRGIARDLAVAGLGTLKPLNAKAVPAAFETPIKVELKNTDACPVFFGRLIKGVKNGPSPDWLQDKLKAIGLRPISTLVDITNYFTIAYCRPLHVFDADKVKGNIHVRYAKNGETFAALNDKSYELKDTMTAICDDSGVLGLGGIVGGTSTGVDENTTNVYLECAWFDPMKIARAGRSLDVISDARYRFERGVDPEFMSDATEMATQMILDLCGGQAGSVIKAGELPQWQRTIEYDPSYATKLMGYEIPASQQKDILTRLGFQITEKGALWLVMPPSWRPDIEGRADLVEECARINGFDKIPATSVLKDEAVAKPAETPRLARMRKVRGVLASHGLQECITWSMMSSDMAEKFGANDRQKAKALRLTNPISADLDQMRPSILPNLVQAAQRNTDRGHPNAALFEIGPIFFGTDVKEQPMVATGIRAGSMGERHWSGPQAHRRVDAYDAKADALQTLAACGLSAQGAQITREAPSWYHPGRSGAIRLGNNVVAYFGELHPGVLKSLDMKDTVVGFEVFIESVPEPKKKNGTAFPLVELSQFMPVRRDFAFIVDQATDADLIARTIKLTDRELISDVTIFDVYAGKGVVPGKKSIAVAVTLQPKDRTLTDADIESISKKIVDAVSAKAGATLRS